MTAITPLFTTVAVGGIIYRREDDGAWVRHDQAEARLGDLDAALDRVAHLEHTIDLAEADLGRYRTVTRIVAPHLTPDIVHNLIPSPDVSSTP